MTRDELEEMATHYDEHDTTQELEHAEPLAPLPADEVMIVTSVRLPKPLMDKVRERARVRGVKPTALIREWVEAAVTEQDEAVPLSVIMAAVAEYQHKRAS
jgi:hypothetical protein